MKKILLLAVMATSLSLGACSKDDGEKITLSSTNQTLFYGDEFQIEATSNNPITYTSENEYHATVSVSGLVTAERVGETNIVLTDGNDTKKLKITVKPVSNLYPEPELSFGMSRASIKSKYGLPDFETDSGFGYDDYSNNAPAMMCLFDESDKLSSYSIMIKTAYSSELGTFLGERYVHFAYSSESYSIGFVNGLSASTITMGVGASLYNISYWMVVYFPFTISRSGDAVDHVKIKSAIDELMNVTD